MMLVETTKAISLGDAPALGDCMLSISYRLAPTSQPEVLPPPKPSFWARVWTILNMDVMDILRLINAKIKR